MDKKIASLLESWEKLKREILLYVNDENQILGKEHDLPYRDRMSNFIRKAKSIEGLPEEYSCFLSSDGIYKKLELENEIVRVKMIQPLTLERLKEEVDAARMSGFTTGDKWKYDIKNYASYHGIKFEEVMHMIGYSDYSSPKKRSVGSAIKELEEWSKNSGYVLDGIYGSEAEQALRFLYRRASDLDIDGGMYVMLMSDKLKIHKGRLYVDYISVVERKYQDYVEKHGHSIENMKRLNPNLYNMLLHLEEYAPGGSVSVDQVRAIFGFEPTGRGGRRERVEIPAGEIMDYAQDGVVSNLSANKELHDTLIKASLAAGTTVESLISDGLVYKRGMSLPRLAKIEVSYTQDLFDIKRDVVDAWERAGVSEDDIATKEKIALSLYDKEMERVISRFCSISKIKR